MTEFMKTFKTMMEENRQFIDENGNIKTPEDIENEIREEEYFNVVKDENDETTTSEERQILKTAAKKVVNDEELTEEEDKLTEEKSNLFTKFVKVEQKVQEKLNNITTPSVDSETKTKTILNKYGNIEPRSLFGLFSQDKNDIKFRTNLYKCFTHQHTCNGKAALSASLQVTSSQGY